MYQLFNENNLLHTSDNLMGLYNYVMDNMDVIIPICIKYINSNLPDVKKGVNRVLEKCLYFEFDDKNARFGVLNLEVTKDDWRGYDLTCLEEIPYNYEIHSKKHGATVLSFDCGSYEVYLSVLIPNYIITTKYDVGTTNYGFYSEKSDVALKLFDSIFKGNKKELTCCQLSLLNPEDNRDHITVEINYKP